VREGGATTGQTTVSHSGGRHGWRGGEAERAGSGGCGHGGMPRWGARSALTRSGPPPQAGQRGGEVGSVLAVGDSGGLEGRRAVAAAAATAKSWRQRVSLS